MLDRGEQERYQTIFFVMISLHDLLHCELKTSKNNIKQRKSKLIMPDLTRIIFIVFFVCFGMSELETVLC